MGRTLFVVLFLLSLLMMPGGINAAADTGIDVGKQAPQFELQDLKGRTVAPLQKQGKTILLTFWSTLCSPCIAEMPSLDNLQSSMRDRDFEVIAVAIDSSDKPVREFVTRKKISFTVLLDPEKEVFFDLYAGPTLPASYLIDRKGIIVEKFSGPRQWDSPEMKNRIRMLSEKR